MKIRPAHFPFFIAILALVAGYFIVGVMAYWLFWPYQTLQINNFASNGLVTTQGTVYRLGQPVVYMLDYCKYTDVPSIVHRVLVDGEEIALSDSTGYLALGCHKTFVETATIPETINPGVYYLDITVIYPVNPIRQVTIHYRTNSFDVIR
jgi:hypothetical protein